MKALRALPSEVSWKAEERVVGDTYRVGLKRAQQHGRIDWLLEARGDEGKPPLLLGVEVKIEADVQNPLKEVYYKDLESRHADAWGLLVLVRNRPGDGLLNAEQAHWLGVALWRDVIAELRHVRPSTQTLTLVWPVLLEVLSDDDDLGAAEITLESLTTDGARRKLEILAEHAKATVAAAVADALSARSRGRMAREIVVGIDRRSRQSVDLQCFYLDPEEGPAIELKLSVVDGNLHMTSGVEPLALRRRLVRKTTRAERGSAIEGLEALKPAFRADSDNRWIRDITLSATQGDLRDTVAEAAQNEVELVIRTGILDQDL